MGHQYLPSLITIFLLDLLHLSLPWKITIFALIVTDIKTVPFVWHLRLLNALRFVLPCQRAKHGPTPDSIFQPLVTSSHCSLSEMDFNWHKSNSTYYSDLDIARTHLLCTLFSTGIDSARHEHGNGLLGVRKESFTIKLGGVTCTFKREIKPYQRYEMWTRVLSWDAKWLYTITHFVRKNPKCKDGNGIVCATAVSKCVFKSGRRTIAPEVMLRTSGLLPRDVFPGTVSHHLASKQGPQEESLGAERQYPFAPVATLQQSGIGDAEQCMQFQTVKDPQTSAWTFDMIDEERRRGMAVVDGADPDGLEQEFCADVDILGRHFDL